MAFLDDILSGPYGGILGSLLGRDPASIYASIQSGLQKARDAGNSRQGVDEAGFAGYAPPPAQAPVFNQPTPEQAGLPPPLDYYTSPFGGLQVATAAPAPAIDMSARQRTPVPAITQADIQTPQQASPAPLGAPQVPQLPQPQSPDLLQRLQAGAINFTTGGNPIAGLFNTISGLATGQRTDATGIALQNQKQMAAAALQYIKSKNPNMPDDQAASLAQMAAVDPKIGQELFKPSTSAEAAMVHPLGGGGGGQGLDTITKLTAAKTLGQEQGKQQAGVENATAALDYTLSKIDELKKDPSLKYVVGNPALANVPAAFMTGKMRSSVARIEQLKGQAIADVLNSVRGLGLQRATQNELFALRDGFARLQRDQSLPDFMNALDDMRARVAKLRTNVGTQAGIGATPPPAPAAAQSGVVDYRDYFGTK